MGGKGGKCRGGEGCVREDDFLEADGFERAAEGVGMGGLDSSGRETRRALLGTPLAEVETVVVIGAFSVETADTETVRLIGSVLVAEVCVDSSCDSDAKRDV